MVIAVPLPDTLHLNTRIEFLFIFKMKSTKNIDTCFDVVTHS